MPNHCRLITLYINAVALTKCVDQVSILIITTKIAYILRRRHGREIENYLKPRKMDSWQVSRNRHSHRHRHRHRIGKELVQSAEY
jgi:ABC-type nickel/cobalt efflux system permease component RcnA